MNKINWDFLDKVIYINLNKRKDRRVRMAKHLKSVGIPRDKIIRFEAIEHKLGYVGCAQSHIAVLEMASDNDWERVLILEDDFCFNTSPSNYTNIANYFSALLNINWSVAFLAANYSEVTPLKSVDYIVRVNIAWCACAYIVNKSYYPKIIHNFRTSLLGLLQENNPKKYAIDVNWHHCMQRDLWLGIFPNSGYQLPDRSDIEQNKVDYRYLFEKPLEEITPPDKFISSTSGPIKVDFYFQWPPGWTNFESVIDAMKKNPNFDCNIIVVPYLNWKAKDLNGDIQRKMLKERGIKFIGFEHYDLYERQPDVVFLQNPYDEARPEKFGSSYLHKRGVKIAYIPYALDTGNGEESMIYQYNLLCQNVASWIFARSQRHKDEFAVQCYSGNKNVYVTGHPKLDYYDKRFGTNGEEKNKGPSKVFLWTPHFVLPGDVKMYTTFNIYCDAIIKIIMRDDIRLIIRPHPLFKQWLSEASEETQSNYKRLVAVTEQRNNVNWDYGPDYTTTFSKSDALISDASSFLLEYLPSKKPILYLTHEKCHGLNKTADFIYHSYDVAWCEDDIYQFIENIVNGRDNKKHEREKVLTQELQIDTKNAGEKIAEVIFSALRCDKY